MSGALKEIWEKVDQMIGPQRMETEAEHIARDMREGRFPERSDPIQVPVAGTEATAIARMAEGDGLVERLNRADEYEPLGHDGWEAAAHIAALTAQNREMALDVLASSGQAQEAYAAQIAAEAERDALRAKVARLEGALQNIDALDDNAECCGQGVCGGYSPPECCGKPFYGLDRAQNIARAALTIGAADE